MVLPGDKLTPEKTPAFPFRIIHLTYFTLTNIYLLLLCFDFQAVTNIYFHTFNAIFIH